MDAIPPPRITAFHPDDARLVLRLATDCFEQGASSTGADGPAVAGILAGLMAEPLLHLRELRLEAQDRDARHAQRVTQLLEANNREVERRRTAERQARLLEEAVCEVRLAAKGATPEGFANAWAAAMDARPSLAMQREGSPTFTGRLVFPSRPDSLDRKPSQ